MRLFKGPEPPSRIRAGFVVGPNGGTGRWWADDLDALFEIPRGRAPGLFWIRWLTISVDFDLSLIRSLKGADWGFLLIRPEGGCVLGTPGAALTVKEAIEQIWVWEDSL